MKKIIIAIIVLLMVAGLAACANPLKAAVSQMAENNDAQDNSDSGAASNDGQMDIDINEDGSSINISGDDGNVTIEGDEDGMAWPGDKLPSSVPEISGVKVVMVMDMDGGVLVAFEGCEQATADAYIAQLAGAGWDSSMNLNSDEGYTIFFEKGNEVLQFGWSKADKTGSILYGISE